MKRIIAVLFAFITVGSVFGQQLGTATPFQRILNELPAIPIAGRNLEFQFGGTTWIATVNGENVLSGTVELVDVSGGSILTLKQTHIRPRLPEGRIAEARAAGVRTAEDHAMGTVSALVGAAGVPQEGINNGFTMPLT